MIIFFPSISCLLDVQSIIDVDSLFLEFSLAYCKERQSNVVRGVLSPPDTVDFADDAQIYHVGGTLSYRLLQAGFYWNHGKITSEIMTEQVSIHLKLGGLTVFALITEMVSAALIAAVGNNFHSAILANHLHSVHALGIYVILNNALRLGRQSPDCLPHLLNAYQFIREMDHTYSASMRDTETKILKNALALSHLKWSFMTPDSGLDRKHTETENYNLPDVIQSFCVAHEGISECLTVEQTGVGPSALITQVDQISDTSAEVIPLPTLLNFIYYILQASGADLAPRAQPHPPSTPETKEAIIRSLQRLPLHLLRACTLISQHLAAFPPSETPSSVEANAEKLLIYLIYNVNGNERILNSPTNSKYLGDFHLKRRGDIKI
ncbi:hypothetical protein ACTXT7_006438 [Hymenolepis weldensis]